MFPRGSRLRRKKDIAAVLSRGLRVGTPALTLRMINTKFDHPKITVVVGTVVSKKATVRNRVKRQLRHILAAELKSVTRGVDLMFTIRISFLNMSGPERLSLVHSILKRARLI